ncbi:MAG: fructosamine kinase family protein, partial [Cyanobacteriota bacterium]
MWEQIAQAISKATGETFTIENRRSVSGGSINQSYSISNSDRTYFLKLNQASQVGMFEAEALGLEEMYETQTIRVPKPICWGMADSSAYIVMEWLEFGRGGSTESWAEMGRKLAGMHRKGTAEKFGWQRNNTIGSTPQINTWTDNWADFFAEHRIGYQLQLARRKGGNFPNPNEVIPA